MRYIIRFGVLCRESDGQRLASIKGSVTGPEKKIRSEDAQASWSAGILSDGITEAGKRDIRKKEYVLRDQNSHIAAIGKPQYKEGDEPDATGWPLSRLPRVDHAELSIYDIPYRLTMYTGRRYDLQDRDGNSILRIVHRGISGGWNLETQYIFPAEIICGIFVFCRYIEYENEFLTV